MQTCIAEHRALWLGSWRTRFFSLFSSAGWLDTIWPTRPLFSPSLWSVLCKFSLTLSCCFFFFLKLSTWWFSAQPCVLITTYPLINFPHSVFVNVYVAFVLPTNHSSPPIFPPPPPICLFPPLLPPIPQGALLGLCLIEGGYGPDLHCWAEAAQLLKRIPSLVWAADSSCVIVVLLRDARRKSVTI